MGRCRITRKKKQRSFHCTIRLSKGTWRITTRALSAKNVVLRESVKVKRLK